ncbi:hypothetical protein DL98DRAFT_553259 [Cadophora sp. DSE1049]|nr:hypothetical protein DL98DRAFT_553259 [Cadophora sp. DSE1049]
MAVNEETIQSAIVECNKVLVPNYTKIAGKFKLDRRTLARRYQGQTVSRTEANSDQINKLTKRNLPLTSQIVKNLAEEICGREVNKNWTANFVRRRGDRLRSAYLCNIDNERAKSEYHPNIVYFFNILIEGIEKYNITGENIHNWDEKGFLIGLAQSLKRIMTKEDYKSGRIKHAIQDGSRSFISLLACICADGTAIPPALIYEAETGDLQDSWLEDFSEKDLAYFGSSLNGWSSNAFGLNWLKKVGRRLLIVDGHSSHRMQPCDVGCFLLLSTAYFQEINDITFKSGGLVSMSKRLFWSCFKNAWEKALIPDNIYSAFKRTGIWPFHPPAVLDIITLRAKTPPPDTLVAFSAVPKTPYTPKSMRQFTHALQKNPSKEMIRKLIKANETNAANYAIAEHRAKGLTEAIRIEKKKRKRGKRLGLTGKDTTAGQWFGPDEIQEARDRQANQLKEAEEAKEAKVAKKIQDGIDKAIKKALEEREKEDKAAQKALNAQMKKEIERRDVLDRQAARKAAFKAKKAAKTAQARGRMSRGASSRRSACEYGRKRKSRGSGSSKSYRGELSWRYARGGPQSSSELNRFSRVEHSCLFIIYLAT